MAPNRHKQIFMEKQNEEDHCNCAGHGHGILGTTTAVAVADLDGNGYAGYNKAGNEITAGTVYGYEAVAATFTKATGAGNVAHWLLRTPWLMMLLPNTAPIQDRL